MINNNLKIAIRQLAKYRMTTLVNILGLALGLTCCLVIFLFVRQEFNYDRYHEKADRLFRVAQKLRLEGETIYSARSPVPMGVALKESFPQMEAVVRFWRAFQPKLHHADQHHLADGLYFADPEATRIFSLDWLSGDPETALEKPGSIILTESEAVKYFGDEEPVGQTLRYEGYPEDSLQLVVTGVIKNLPENTHLHFTGLVSMLGVQTEWDNWGSFKPIWTYALLKPQYAASEVENLLQPFVDRNFPIEAGSSVREREMFLEPITDIHLFSKANGGFKAGGDITYVYLFSAIGLFILLLGCINFTNLATARSLRRAREVGVRKVLGARKNQLIRQFLGESLFQTGLAFILAIALTEFLLPVVSRMLDRDLELQYLENAWLILLIPALLLIVSLLAGGYPAFFLSGFRPAIALRGTLSSNPAGAVLRRVLVVFQFAVSIGLMIATVLVFQQLNFVRHKNLGFDKEQVVVLPYSPKEKPLLQALESNPDILNVSVSQRVPVNELNTDGRFLQRKGREERVQVQSYIIDDRFLDTYRISLVAGRNLSAGRLADSSAFLLNERAVKAMGWNSPEEALGQAISWSGQKEGRVIGVVRDFHLGSLHEQIEPLVLHSLPQYQYWRVWISVRLRPGAVAGVLPFLEQTWRRFTPDGAYRYFFIDESLNALHQADRRFGQLVGWFAALAILIACLGLWGLAAFSAERRTKEIGIRKVFGAGSLQIVLLLWKDFVLLVLMGLVIAAPMAYLGMNRWLENFAYRTSISAWVFVATGLTALTVAILTISYHSLRAAHGNPVNAIRYE